MAARLTEKLHPMADAPARSRGMNAFVVAAETSRIALVFTDGMRDENPIIFANDAFIALTGFDRPEILGAPLRLVLSDLADPKIAVQINAALEEDGGYTWDARCRRADASELRVSAFIRPVHDRDGVVRQNILSLLERAPAADRSPEHRLALHALYEQTPGFIAISEGPEHRFVFANASYRRFVGRDHLVGMTVADALPEFIDQGIVERLDAVYRIGEQYVGRHLLIAFRDPATGATAERYCDFVCQAVRDGGDTITGLFCEGYDLTDQQQTADALAALQSELIHVSRVNAMGTMATTLAHELNQPLSAIVNYTASARRLLEAPDTADDHLCQALKGIEEASERAAEIIRNLREMTRRREPRRVAFSLKDAIEECIRLIRASTPPSIVIQCTIPDTIMMAADRVQIQQVVINLLRNASEAVASSDRQEVEITSSVREDDIVVSVTDTGPGVSRDAAQNIFSWSDSLKAGGMGLGLSICRTIMDAHRGRIWLEHSDATGTEFCFAVPCEPTAVQARADRGAAATPVARARGGKDRGT